MISPAKQIWKDFSSGKGGNVVAFLMEHEQLSYPQAIKFLANKYNIEVLFEDDESGSFRDALKSFGILSDQRHIEIKRKITNS